MRLRKNVEFTLDKAKVLIRLSSHDDGKLSKTPPNRNVEYHLGEFDIKDGETVSFTQEVEVT